MLGTKTDTMSFEPPAERYDAVIFGAGVSGLVSASILLSQGCRRILIADSYDHVGGNHIDWSVSGYTFDVGSFIFQDDSPLLKHFPELLPRYTVAFPAWGRLNPQGRVTAYPISLKDDIVRAGPIEWTRMLISLLYARLFYRKMGNAREFARYWIGSRLLHSSGLDSYMKRFYGVAPDEIDIQLAQKRMLWISEHASFKNLVRRALALPQARRGSTNRQLVRPKEGFRFLYEAVVERLQENGVVFRLGAVFRTIERTDKTFLVRMEDRAIASDRLISTIPINHMEEICGLKSNSLGSITLLSLFFSFAGKRGFAPSILYNFSHEGAWKRLTMYSDFYGLVNGREYFTAEVIGNHVNFSAEMAEQDFRRQVQGNRLFDGDLRLEGSMVLENAYPIYTEGSGERAARAIRALEAFGIESFGRQGGFNYQPTARVSTIDAESALKG
jgi:hypothetical protein